MYVYSASHKNRNILEKLIIFNEIFTAWLFNFFFKPLVKKKTENKFNKNKKYKRTIKLFWFIFI